MKIILGCTSSGKTHELYDQFISTPNAVLFRKELEFPCKLEQTQNTIITYRSGERLLKMLKELNNISVFIDDVPQYIGLCYLDTLKTIEEKNNLKIIVTLQTRPMKLSKLNELII